MARRSFLLYSTVQVKCPREFTEEEADSFSGLRDTLEDHAKDMQEEICHVYPKLSLEVKVTH